MLSKLEAYGFSKNSLKLSSATRKRVKLGTTGSRWYDIKKGCAAARIMFWSFALENISK